MSERRPEVPFAPARWRAFFRGCAQIAVSRPPFATNGKLTRVAGLVMEATGLQLAVGSGCLVEAADGAPVEAEVVGFSGEHLYLMPAAEAHGLAPGARVSVLESLPPPPRPGLVPAPRRRASDRTKQMPVGRALLGRVLDGSGRPLDRGAAPPVEQWVPLYGRPYNPLERQPIREVLDVGVRAINALLTVGRGQRMGLFSGSGVGKSVLLGMMARYTSADVTVVGLIGERGREVKEFIEHTLGAEGLARSVIVAAPAGTSPLMRLQGAAYATAIAEYFRDQGRHVLLIMDSLTRYAMACREIGLAIGEPPATRGYPPSVFARLPQLVERAGNGPAGGGSITAFYTVLTEGDDPQDPIADSARAILDGHVVLTRALAEQGHFPAIDLEQSVSRALPALVDPPQLERVRRLRQLYSRYQRNQDLLAVGAYQAGADPLLDLAIKLRPRMEAFLRQDMNERVSYGESCAALSRLLASEAGAAP